MQKYLDKIIKILLLGLIFYRTLCPSIAFAVDLEEGRKREAIPRLTHQTQLSIPDNENKELKKTKMMRFIEAYERLLEKLEAIYDANIDRACRFVLYGFCVPASICAVSMLVYILYEMWQQPDIRTCNLHELSQALAPHATSPHALRRGFQTLGVTEENVTALVGYGFSMIFGNVSEWVKAGGGSFPGTESFSESLANDEASQKVLVTYGGLANNTCPDISPLQKAVSGIQKPSSGMSAVCAYETNSVRARLLACDLMQLPSGFQMMIVNCLLNTMDWGDSGANVVAVLGSNGAVTVSGRKRVLTNTAELTRTVEEPRTSTISSSILSSYTKSFLPSKTYTLSLATKSHTFSLKLSPSKSLPISLSHTLSQTFTHALPTPAPPTPAPPPPCNGCKCPSTNGCYTAWAATNRWACICNGQGTVCFTSSSTGTC